MEDCNRNETGLSEEQIAQCEEAFRHFDRDGDGKISSDEMGHVMRALGQQPTEDEIFAAVKAIDEDGNGTVEFPEFLEVMARRLQSSKTEEETRTVFRVFDKNGDGYISADELKELMSKLGEELSDADIHDMIKEADLDEDGLINYSEFVHIMTMK